MSSYSVKMITRVSVPRGPALAQGRAQVLANPGEEATDACIGQVTARLRHLGHGVEQVLFARKQGLGRRIGQRPEGRRGRRFDLRLFFCLEVLFTERGALVIAVDAPR